jgi:hypothetical protein
LKCHILNKNILSTGAPKVKDVEDDVSLITGGMRSSGLSQNHEVDPIGNQVINWLGLNVNEESPSSVPSEVHQGRSGIASSYADEPAVS